MERNECKSHPDVKIWLKIIETYENIQAKLNNNLAQYNLSLPQIDTLVTLRHSGGISQQELAEKLLVTKGNICGLVDRLAEKGFVERRGCPNDRRINHIFITDLGNDLLDKVFPQHQQLLQDTMSVLSDLQKNELINILQLLNQNNISQ